MRSLSVSAAQVREPRSADDLGIDPDPFVDAGRAVNGIAQLDLQTRYVGARLHYLKSVGSTNAALVGLAQHGEPPGTVVIADEQTEGRGRAGRSWFSPAARGIWASVLLRADMPPARLAPLSVAGAVCAAEALAGLTGLDVGVKWPNDLLVKGRKLGGLLVEAVQSSDGNVGTAAVGIGVNVNLTREELPPELAESATSLRIELGHEVPRLDALRAVLLALEGCFDEFIDRGVGSFVARWREASTLLGRPVLLEASGRRVEGTVTGMAPSGAILLRLASGDTEEVWQGDMKLRTAERRGSEDG